MNTESTKLAPRTIFDPPGKEPESPGEHKISKQLLDFKGLKPKDLTMQNGEYLAPLEAVGLVVAKRILQGNYFSHTERGVETVEKDLDQATAVLKKAQQNFHAQLEQFLDTKTKFLADSKKATSDAKQMMDSMAASVKKIESSMNIDKLERVAKTLSQIAESFEKLQKIAASGQLESVIKGLSSGK